MSTKAPKGTKPIAAKGTGKRAGVKAGTLISVAGGAMKVGSAPAKSKNVPSKGNWSPLSDIVRQIKQNPSLGEKIAKDAGITTKAGRLTKTYAG
ncbi:hypothetical protein [Achromobacter xylosoxidans]|uniref:hypothetical protein n=1 Tax=Alcaligenes xylosoxydans xylosoxydans TaxID=85698 RepID=UPI001F12F304|nr:hypothetical protein [Achromobacter xylosoxidans]